MTVMQWQLGAVITLITVVGGASIFTGSKLLFICNSSSDRLIILLVYRLYSEESFLLGLALGLKGSAHGLALGIFGIHYASNE